MSAVFLQELGVVCAAGQGQAAVADALFATDGPRGVAMTDAVVPGRRLALGIVHAPLPTLADRPLHLRGRNNGLLAVALAEIRPAVDAAIARFGAHRVAIVVGTSTSDIGQGERAQVHYEAHGAWPADYHYGQQEMGTAAAFLAAELGTTGPAHVISTACSSSTKALAAGARLIRAGLADAVIAGGADSMCRFTVAGFGSLESVSAERCNPFSANRRGINIGEGAALFLLGRDAGPVRLAGWGESSDAHHMSAPEPKGRAPRIAVDQALARAGIVAADLDYVNLHGTATPQNDAMEAGMVAGLGAAIPCSSTKPLTGHTLGAAGAIEAALCWLTLARNPQWRIPAHWWDGVVDPALAPLALVPPGAVFARAPGYVLTQNFAFGGSNAALVLGAG